MRLMKGVLAFRILIKRLLEIGRVQQGIVNVEPDGFIVPVHPPDVKFPGPIRIVEPNEGLANGVPFRHPALFRSPGHIRQEHAPVILYNVDLAIAWPFAIDA